MLPQRPASERLGQVEVNKLTVPGLTTSKTMGVFMAGQQIPLDATATSIRRTIRACHLQAQLLRVVFKADRTGHFVFDAKKIADGPFNFCSDVLQVYGLLQPTIGFDHYSSQ